MFLRSGHRRCSPDPDLLRFPLLYFHFTSPQSSSKRRRTVRTATEGLSTLIFGQELFQQKSSATKASRRTLLEASFERTQDYYLPETRDTELRYLEHRQICTSKPTPNNMLRLLTL